jgi:hypothetical protein
LSLGERFWWKVRKGSGSGWVGLSIVWRFG